MNIYVYSTADPVHTAKELQEHDKEVRKELIEQQSFAYIGLDDYLYIPREFGKFEDITLEDVVVAVMLPGGPWSVSDIQSTMAALHAHAESRRLFIAMPSTGIIYRSRCEDRMMVVEPTCTLKMVSTTIIMLNYCLSRAGNEIVDH